MAAPSADARGSTNTEHPVFCVQYLDNFDQCQSEDYEALAKTLRKLSRLTWGQINQSHKHAFGFEKIPVHQLRVPLSSIADGHEFVIVFRYKGKMPMLCLRHEETLRILHLDCTHTAYG